MSRTQWSFALLASFACATSVEAGTVTGTIERIDQIIGTETTVGRPFLLVRVLGTVDVPPPACNNSNRFVIDLTTQTGIEAARLVQLLYATGRTGRVIGNGTCSVYGGSETAVEVDGF